MRTYFRFASHTVCILAGIVVNSSLLLAAAAEKGGTKKQQEVNPIENYDEWVKVNPEPLYLAPRIAAMCAVPDSTRKNKTRKRNPHEGYFFTVYVNPLGEKAMMNDLKPRYPVGTVIVKEKLPSKDSNSPELLTVMIKQEKGYDESKGDWEYSVYNGADLKVAESGKIARCQSCHIGQKELDYVYRSYLSEEIKSKLK